MAELDEFRAEDRGRGWWKTARPGPVGRGRYPNGSTKIKIRDRDTMIWLGPHDRERLDRARLAGKNTAVAGLDKEEFLILVEEDEPHSSPPGLCPASAPA